MVIRYRLKTTGESPFSFCSLYRANAVSEEQVFRNGGEFIGKKSEERTSAAIYTPCYIGVRQNEAARTVVKIN